MRLIPMAIADVVRIEPALHEDARGRFAEVWRRDTFAAAGIDAEFVQENISRSHRGVLRGLHYQHPHAQGKLVRCIHGAIFDVAVDLRRGSPDFGRWVGCELDDVDAHALWIPPGFAHGFLSLADETEVIYRVTETHHPESEQVLAWDDPALAIAWPLDRKPQLGPRDRAGVALAAAVTY